MKSKVEQQATRIKQEQWNARGERLFGKDQMKWRFVCPSCGHIAAAGDYKKAGASSDNVGFSCIGRWLPNPKEAFTNSGGPCNYAGGGLFRINPVLVILPDGSDVNVFEFAEVGSAT